jgi:hypothetical protein
MYKVASANFIFHTYASQPMYAETFTEELTAEVSLQPRCVDVYDAHSLQTWWLE